MEDEKIIGLYFERDEEAIPQTEAKYGSACRALSLRIVSSPEDSEECVSDTWMALWNAMPPTCPRHLGAYIMGVTRKLSLSCLRRRYADRRGGGEYALCFEELDEAISGKGSPQSELELRELAAEINRFLSRLSADDRRIFVSRYWLMAPLSQIAESSGFSESKVKSSLYRSRAALKKQLVKEGLL